MSVVYLSFGSIAALHNNAQLAKSVIGELSNKSKTYAKDPGVYTLPTVRSDTVLYNFSSQRDATNILLPQALAEVQISICNWLYDQAKLGNITSSRPNTLALLKATFTNNITIDDIGEMVTNNTYWMPSFVEGTHKVGADYHKFFVWLADAYFQEQYPKVVFTIVHPIPLSEIDTLMTMNFQQIETRFRKETPDIIEARTHAATQDAAWPYTERKIIPFDIVDLINTPNVNPGYWTYLRWGNDKDAEDQLFEQIQNEILAASQYPRARWEEKIPDLFNPLEYYSLPHFNRLGLKNRTDGASQYSPIADRQNIDVLSNKYLVPNMTQAHVIKSMQIVPFLYKSLHCAMVGKVNIRPGMEKITSQYPDYSLVPSTDVQFGQMNEATTEFIRQMENLLAAAEVVTPVSLLPTGISRVDRFGKAWVSCRSGGVKFLALTRWQMVQDNVVVE